MPAQITPLYPVSGTDAAKVQGIPVSTVDPTTGQILVYDAVTQQYVPQPVIGTATGLRTAAARDVGQLAGNVLEFSGNGTVTLGDNTDKVGTLTVKSGGAGGDVGLRNEDGELVFIASGGEVNLFGPGTLALTSDITAANLTGTVPVSKGGTGLTAVGTSGNVLTSNGTAWVSSAPAAGVSAANPTATIGATAVNGSAATFMRSDAAPALPATLPALSGVNLTALNASNLSSGTVSLARLVNTQTVGNADATISAGTRDVLLTAALTAPRTYTLPAASGYPAGARITFVDSAQTLTAANTATLLRAGSDTINGGTSIVLNTAGASPLLISDGTSKWTLDIRGVSRGGTGATSLTSGAILIGGGTGPITTSAVGTGVLTALGVNVGSAGAFVRTTDTATTTVAGVVPTLGGTGLTGAPTRRQLLAEITLPFRYVIPLTGSGSSSGNSTSAGVQGGMGVNRLTSGAVAGARNAGMTFPWSAWSSSYNNADWSQPLQLSGMMNIDHSGTAATDTRIRAGLGKPNTYPLGALAARGFVIEARWTGSAYEIFCGVHNGTTLNIQTTGLTMAKQNGVVWSVEADGAGNAVWYVHTGSNSGNGITRASATLALTGAPTGTETTSRCAFAEIDNGAAGGASLLVDFHPLHLAIGL